jgi:sterol desaturase/sphingolipid hydroxylase (fatty acid hydroxylase superfamily)
MIYSVWPLGFSLLFLILERAWPRQRRPLLRRHWSGDLFYLVFNGEYLGVLVGVLSIHALGALDRVLDLAHLRQYFYLGVMNGQPLWIQFAVLLVVFDFSQWLIHNLLHRVPWLWEFHKVHHSIEELDWIGNWRFHWLEVVVYRALLYIPAAFFGFSGEAMFWNGVAGTLVGHFAHSNLRVRVGPLRYLINSPEMHVWHHAHPQAGPVNRNFGLTLSVWDWLFGTGYVPGRDPARLGFERIETFPTSVWGQWLAPFAALFRARPARHATGVMKPSRL